MRGLLALGALLGCSTIGEEGEVEACGVEIEPTIESIQENVLNPSCTPRSGCHNQVAAEAHLRLGCAVDTDGDGRRDVLPTSGATVALACWHLVGVAADNPDHAGALRVVPGDPEASYLVQKLQGRELAGGGDDCPMPSAATACDTSRMLAPCLIDAVERWIADGAPGCEEPPDDLEEIDWDDYCANGGL